MARFILICITFVLFYQNAKSEGIDSLLDAYAQEADLSNTTKKESAGLVDVYTRRDLERMQVQSLFELLKNLNFYRYNEDTFGYTDLTYKNFQPSKSNNFRVYLNEHELITPYYGNGLTLFSQIDFALIDHVEIYRGIPSFEFGVESASYVVKLYSKDPSRELGGRVKTSLADNGTTDTNIYYADELEKFSYIGYLDLLNLKRNKYNNLGTQLLKDKKGYHGYVSISNENHRLEMQAVGGTTKNFMGKSGDGTPLKAQGNGDYFYIGTTSKFMDKTLELALNYQRDILTYEDEDDNPIIYMPPMTTYSSLKQKLQEEMFTLKVKKDFNYQNNNLMLGVQFREKKFNLKELILDGVKQPNYNGYDNEDIYSFYIENKYMFNNRQMLIASIKNDLVRPNKTVKNQNLWMGRLGYIHNLDDIVFKAFYSHMEFKAEPILYSSYNGNANLDPEKRDMLTGEIAYTKSSHKLKFQTYFARTSDNIYTNTSTFMYDNYTKNIDSYGANVAYTYNFNSLNKLDIAYFLTKTKDKMLQTQDTTYGGNIRLLNTYNNIDIYNGLIYKGGYEGLSDGFDYNFAITYHHTKDLSFSIKGENVFDKALKSIYKAVDVTNPTSITTIGPVSSIDQRFWISMEYLF